MVKKRKSRFNKRKKSFAEKIKPLIIILAIIATIGLIIWGVLKVMESPFLKAKITWEINDELPITQTKLAESIQSLTNDKYQLDTDTIQEILQSHPWVAKAQITNQRFSNDIQIKILPQQIAMRWESSGCQKKKTPGCTGYISNTGELFQPKKSVESKAPLAHSTAKPEVIAQLYQDYQTYQKQAIKMPIQSFYKTHIDKLVFASDVHVILGYQEKQKRLSRFLKAYKKLQTKKTNLKRSTFDMRYPKGFSLKYH